jgi:hypothetical protein
MSGDDRLNRKQTPSRSTTSLSIILIAIFAAAGIAGTLALSHFDTSMPVQLLAP